MNILGLQKTTLLDFPGRVASTVFIGGCNMRCPFCHNMNLVQQQTDHIYSQCEVLDFLRKRQGILDGVCITGGEPTLYPELLDFIRKIKSLGFLVKLDTNGTNPDMIKYLSEEGLIDYIAMDIKSSIEKYTIVCGNENIDTHLIRDSISTIINGHIDYEFRTTVIKNYHDTDTIKEMGLLIKGAKRYFLQNYMDSDYVPDHSLEPCDTDTLNKYLEILSSYVETVNIRGI